MGGSVGQAGGSLATSTLVPLVGAQSGGVPRGLGSGAECGSCNSVVNSSPASATGSQ